MKIHINKLRNLMKEFYRDAKNISPPFCRDEGEKFKECFEAFLKKLKFEESKND